MNRIGWGVGAVGLLGLLGAGGAYWSVSAAAEARMARVVETHEVPDVPVPVPLTPEELAELGEARRAELGDTLEEGADPLAGLDVDAIARQRAIARGERLVRVRYVCVECHGRELDGGTMIDDAMVGRVLGPNITSGGRTKDYSFVDWDRAVRHGLLPDGSVSFMPAVDYQLLSDRELSDMIAYIRSVPASDAVVPEPSLGVLGRILMGTGDFLVSAEIIEHDIDHEPMPPDEAPTASFGRHIAGTCTGCHGEDLGGGTIPGAPPDWPAATNLTPHDDGIGSWSKAQFFTTMRTMVRPDGTALQPPMKNMAAYTSQWTDLELEAMWAYLRSLEPVPGH